MRNLCCVAACASLLLGGCFVTYKPLPGESAEELCGRHGVIRSLNNRDKIHEKLGAPAEEFVLDHTFRSHDLGGPTIHDGQIIDLYWINTGAHATMPLLLTFNRPYLAYYRVVIKYDVHGIVSDCDAEPPVLVVPEKPLKYLLTYRDD